MCSLFCMQAFDQRSEPAPCFSCNFTWKDETAATFFLLSTKVHVTNKSEKAWKEHSAGMCPTYIAPTKYSHTELTLDDEQHDELVNLIATIKKKAAEEVEKVLKEGYFHRYLS